MSDFIVVAGQAGKLFFDGTDAFVKDIAKAKTYATEAAGKRAMNKAQNKTGRNGLRVASAASAAPTPAKKAKAKKKAA